MDERPEGEPGRAACDQARTALRMWFDADAPLEREVMEHTAGCFACRRHRDRLEELRGALHDLAIHAPSSGFIARVRESVATKRPPEPAHRPYATAALVAVAFGCAVLAGWLYPMNFSTLGITAWVESTWRTVEAVSWLDAVQPMTAPLKRLGVTLENRLAGVYEFTPTTLWAAMGTVLAFLAVFNAFEARRDQRLRRSVKRG